MLTPVRRKSARLTILRAVAVLALAVGLTTIATGTGAAATDATVSAATYADAPALSLPGSAPSWGTPGPITFPKQVTLDSAGNTIAARTGAVLPPAPASGCTRTVSGASATVTFTGTPVTPNPGAFALGLSADKLASLSSDVTFSPNLVVPPQGEHLGTASNPGTSVVYDATFGTPVDYADAAAFLILDSRTGTQGQPASWTLSSITFDVTDDCPTSTPTASPTATSTPTSTPTHAPTATQSPSPGSVPTGGGTPRPPIVHAGDGSGLAGNGGQSATAATFVSAGLLAVLGAGATTAFLVRRARRP